MLSKKWYILWITMWSLAAIADFIDKNILLGCLEVIVVILNIMILREEKKNEIHGNGNKKDR